jgi:hypothetical protein
MNDAFLANFFASHRHVLIRPLYRTHIHIMSSIHPNINAFMNAFDWIATNTMHQSYDRCCCLYYNIRCPFVRPCWLFAPCPTQLNSTGHSFVRWSLHLIHNSITRICYGYFVNNMNGSFITITHSICPASRHCRVMSTFPVTRLLVFWANYMRCWVDVYVVGTAMTQTFPFRIKFANIPTMLSRVLFYCCTSCAFQLLSLLSTHTNMSGTDGLRTQRKEMEANALNVKNET